MHAIIVLSLAAVAFAAPQGGYNYQQPRYQPNYQPSYQQVYQPSFQPSFQVIDTGFQSSASDIDPIESSNVNVDQDIDAALHNLNFGNEEIISAPRHHINENSHSVLHKHIYVHEPPKDLHDHTPKVRIAPHPVQRHYKIVFIKAPVAPTINPADILKLQQKQEEKTLVYVLVKKPEDINEIDIPTQAPTEPSKPDVFFIKYKNEQELINDPAIAAATEEKLVSASVSKDGPY